MALDLGWFGGSNLYRYFDGHDELTGEAAIDRVVERIIEVKSSGNPNAKNGRSSAEQVSVNFSTKPGST